MPGGGILRYRCYLLPGSGIDQAQSPVSLISNEQCTVGRGGHRQNPKRADEGRSG